MSTTGPPLLDAGWRAAQEETSLASQVPAPVPTLAASSMESARLLGSTCKLSDVSIVSSGFCGVKSAAVRISLAEAQMIGTLPYIVVARAEVNSIVDWRDARVHIKLRDALVCRPRNDAPMWVVRAHAKTALA